MSAPIIRKIIHVDMDAYYASVEQRDNPELRGKPVAVGHGAERGVVVAASYEARKFGVRSAMPSITAHRNCPELIFVKPRFDIYRAVSEHIRRIFAEYTALIEPLSLDEAYLDVTENIRGLPTASDTAAAIRKQILTETNLTASAGISYNKFLAKLASDMRKPNGQFVIAPQKAAAFIASLPVEKFHGVGHVTAQKLNAHGIVTGADLKAKTLAYLEQNFGKSGSWFYAIARGEDFREVQPNRKRKSSGSETTFKTDRIAPADIEAGVAEMANDVWEWCDTHRSFGSTVTVKIKYSDFRIITRRKTIVGLINSREVLLDLCLGLTRSIYPVSRGIRLVGVSVSNFGTPASQLDLPLE
jgi:DNA polymerase IV